MNDISEKAYKKLSWALGVSRETEAETLMLHAAVRINRLTKELKEAKDLIEVWERNNNGLL